MAIKNARIGMHVDDWQLRTQLAQWFRQNGAIVHSAQGEKEWEQMRGRLELEIKGALPEGRAYEVTSLHWLIHSLLSNSTSSLQKN